MSKVSEIVAEMMHAATSAHILHLGTRSVAAHLALDELYKGLPSAVDSLVECWQGKNGRLIEDWPSGFTPPAGTPLMFVEALSKKFSAERSVLGTDSEIQNLADEIQELLDSALYKLRFLS